MDLRESAAGFEQATDRGGDAQHRQIGEIDPSQVVIVAHCVAQGDAKLAQALIRDKRLDTLCLLPASQSRDKDSLTEDGVMRVATRSGGDSYSRFGLLLDQIDISLDLADACIDRLRSLDAVWIRGNGERWTARPDEAPDGAALDRSGARGGQVVGDADRRADDDLLSFDVVGGADDLEQTAGQRRRVKRLEWAGLQNAEFVARLVAPVMNLVATVGRPAVWVGDADRPLTPRPAGKRAGKGGRGATCRS